MPNITEWDVGSSKTSKAGGTIGGAFAALLGHFLKPDGAYSLTIPELELDLTTWAALQPFLLVINGGIALFEVLLNGLGYLAQWFWSFVYMLALLVPFIAPIAVACAWVATVLVFILIIKIITRLL